MKELKDYLHLYLGCDLWIEEPGETAFKSKFEGIDATGRPIAKEYEHQILWKFNEIKPILRPLSDMTDVEIIKVAKIADCLPIGWYDNNGYWEINRTDHPNIGIEVCCNGKYAIRVTFKKPALYFVDYEKSGVFYLPETIEIFRYLLSKHFDLFGLIDAGLAIDKTTLSL